MSNFKWWALHKTIVRIEFSPVVEISASNGQNLRQETTYVGLALSNVWKYLDQSTVQSRYQAKPWNWSQPILLNGTQTALYCKLIECLQYAYDGTLVGL